MKEKFEILKGLPAYGEMYISIPENGYSEFSEGLAVKFVKNDNTEWIANFETGWSSLKFGTELKNSQNVLIIACGICYLMNPNENKPKVEFGNDFEKVIEYKNKFILVGKYSISIVEDIDKIIHFDDLCYDGIKNVKVENDNLIGILNNYDSNGEELESDFILNLENLKFQEIEKRRILQNENLLKRENKIENKSWWKIW